MPHGLLRAFRQRQDHLWRSLDRRMPVGRGWIGGISDLLGFVEAGLAVIVWSGRKGGGGKVVVVNPERSEGTFCCFFISSGTRDPYKLRERSQQTFCEPAGISR